MEPQILKGIALILFGILLCLGGAEINNTLLRSLSDFPFSVTGVIVGLIGLVMVFGKGANDKSSQN